MIFYRISINYRGVFTIENILKLPTQCDIDTVQSLCDTVQPEDPCYIQFTSGTTGHHKGAEVSHFTCVNGGFASIGKRLQLFDGLEYHRMCIQNPLFHLFGTCGGVSVSLGIGATLCLPGHSFNALESLQAIIKEK